MAADRGGREALIRRVSVLKFVQQVTYEQESGNLDINWILRS